MVILRAAFLIGLVSVTSCTQTRTIPRSTVDELPPLKQIELITASEEENVTGPDARFVNAREGSGALAGAIGGAAAASTCAATIWLGPGVCIASYLLAGTAAGVAFEKANDTGLSDEDFLYVTAAINHSIKDRDLQDEIVTSLSSHLLSIESPDHGETTVRVTPQLAYVGIARPEGDNLEIDIVGWLIFSWVSEEGANERYTAEFQSRSSEADIDSWLANGGSMFSDAVTVGLETVSAEMAAFLNARFDPSLLGAQ